MAGPRIERLSRLDGGQVRDVMALVDAVADADGVAPLSEHVLLHLRYGGDEPTHHLLLRVDDGTLVGYAHLDVTDEVAGSSAELAVHPAHRRQGHATRLVEALLDIVGNRRMRLWAHGDNPGARRLAERMGFRQARALWQMRRSLHATLPQPTLPPGVTIRVFEPGRDEEEFLAVNNRAFADHPEQGKWTIDDVLTREREPWFDPAGFFLAIRDGRIVGFHWTKVHGSDPSPDGHGSHGHEPIGEVYVVGVDPSAQRSGLGPALTLVGLRHLRARGLAQVMLYVDDSNTAAIAVYERLGFTRWDVDTSYRRDAVAVSASGDTAASAASPASPGE
jgi:mycothiol synthase